MVSLTAVTAWGLGMGPLELGDGIGVPLDLAVAVVGATRALDRTAATTEGTAQWLLAAEEERRV